MSDEDRRSDEDRPREEDRREGDRRSGADTRNDEDRRRDEDPHDDEDRRHGDRSEADRDAEDQRNDGDRRGEAGRSGGDPDEPTGDREHGDRSGASPDPGPEPRDGADDDHGEGSGTVGSGPGDGDGTGGDPDRGDAARDPDRGDATGDPNGGETNGDPDREEALGGLEAAEVERVFSVMDAALDALDGRQLDRVLTVLEAVVAGNTGADRETVAELTAMLEDLIVEPDEVDETELAETLTVVEEVLDLGGQDGGDFLSIVEEAFPGSSGIGEALSAAAEAGGFGDLAPFLGGGRRRDRREGDGDRRRSRGRRRDRREDRRGDREADRRGTDGAGADALAGDGVADPFRIARIAAATTRRAVGTSADAGIRTGVRMAHAAANEESPAELLTTTRAIALDELDRAGVDVGETNLAWLQRREEAEGGRPGVDADRLRRRGAALLSESSEVGRVDGVHPAFPTVLGELCPDEARILRLLATEGPQPRVAVRDRGYVPLTTRPVATCLTMLGSDAGCRRPARVPVYLDNLQRLGLVEPSHETVEDLQVYRILEAQSHVEAAHDRATWSKSVYGSLRLTDFGVAFCRACFPFEVTADPPGAAFYGDPDGEAGEDGGAEGDEGSNGDG